MKNVVQLENIDATEFKNEIIDGVLLALKNNAGSLQLNEQTDQLLTRDETAKLLSVSLVTLWDWTKKDIIPAYRIGNKVRYKKSEVLKSLNQKINLVNFKTLFMQINNQALISDALNHLNYLKNDFARLRLDYSRDNNLVYTTGKYIESCELIGQLIKAYDNHNFKLLSNNINSVLLKDSELHGVLITIRKNKHSNNFDPSKMASIIFEI